MAETQKSLLSKITDQLVESNKKLDQLNNTFVQQSAGLSPAAQKQAGEDEKIAADKSNSLLLSISEGITGLATGAKAGGKAGGKTGGILAGIGGALGKMGIGAGVAMGGLGALFAGGGYLLKQLAEFDGKAVVANVKELAKIADIADGLGDAFVKGGSFLLMMLGLGLGLAAFGIGSAIGGVGNAITKFIEPNWAQEIVDNVVILLGLSKEVGGIGTLLAKGGAFFAAMTGIGFGLAVFGAGSAVAGISDALTSFVNPNWAQGIVDNVVILLSLSKEVGGVGTLLAEGGAFFLAMTGIGLGLAVFGVGSAAAGLAQFVIKDDWATRVKNSVVTLLSISGALGGAGALMGESAAFFVAMTGIAVGLAVFALGSAAAGLAQFMIKDDWAQRIVDSVTTLMQISSLNFGDIGQFAIFMTAVAAGLFAFAVGKAATSMGDVIGKFTGNFADNIVKDVNTLLGMLDDPRINQKKADTFSSIMGTIAAGLVKFSAGKFVGTLAGAAASVLNFLTGTESPIKQMEIVAENARELERGAAAIGLITENLDKVGNLKFKGGDLGIEKFAEDLLQSIPDIEVAIRGGKVSTGIFSGTTIKGLGSTDIPWEQAGKNLRIIHEALNIDSKDHMTDALKAGSSIQDKLLKSIEDLTAAIGAGSGGNNTALSVNKQDIHLQGDSPVSTVGNNYGPNNALGGAFN